MTEFDLAAMALLVVCAYGGYRRGLIAFVLHLAGGLLAFGLAAAIAPLAAPRVTEVIDLPGTLVRPVIVVVLTVVLRVVFGYAVRELAATLQALLHSVPPLALLDRLLGIVPGAALGAIAVLALTMGAIALPLGARVHDAAASSWIARTIVARPEDVLATLRRLWDGLVVSPPELGMVPLVIGVSGLWLGAFAAYRLRPARAGADLRDAPTRRIPRAPAFAEADAADPLAWPRTLLGLTAAVALMATLLALTYIRG